MKDLLKLLLERLAALEKRKQTPITLGRVSELQAVILEIQKRLLDEKLKEK